MIRDYWIYQNRQSDAQWAIYVVKEFQRGKPECTCLDLTIYSEDIDTPTHSKSYVGWHYTTVSGYVNSILIELLEFCEVTKEDREQLEKEILRILAD